MLDTITVTYIQFHDDAVQHTTTRDYCATASGVAQMRLDLRDYLTFRDNAVEHPKPSYTWMDRSAQLRVDTNIGPVTASVLKTDDIKSRVECFIEDVKGLTLTAYERRERRQVVETWGLTG